MIYNGEELILDDNKNYSVVFSTIYNNENYVFLIDQDDYLNTMFCKFDNGEKLTEVKDQNIIEELLKLYSEYSKNDNSSN